MKEVERNLSFKLFAIKLPRALNLLLIYIYTYYLFICLFVVSQGSGCICFSLGTLGEEACPGHHLCKSRHWPWILIKTKNVFHVFNLTFLL